MKILNSSFKKTLLASLVVPFALGAQPASAALITDWGYTVSNTLLNALDTSNNSIPAVAGSSGGNPTSTLSWGNSTGSGQSSLSINGVSANAGLLTDVNSVAGGTFTHVNQPITGPSLSSFDLRTTLTLTPAPADTSGGADYVVGPITFSSFFSETPNSGTCAVTTSITPCDDIFTLGNIGVLDTDGAIEFSSPETSFTVDDYIYTVILMLTDLSVLDPTVCAAAGTGAGCIGFVTAERGSTEFFTQFSISATQISVPEPGTLALLGMGIAGLGMSRRKKAAKA